jgi:hypothetical protein
MSEDPEIGEADNSKNLAGFISYLPEDVTPGSVKQ